MSGRDLVVRLAEFAGELRARSVRVSLSDELDAAAALKLVDLLDRDEVRRAMEIALKIRPSDRETFAELFHQFWAGAGERDRVTPATSPLLSDRATGSREPGLSRPAPFGEDQAGAEGPEGSQPGYSPEALLRRKPFDEYTQADLVVMERLLARLALALATCPSRRLAPTRGKGRVDLRRSFRRAVGTRSELLWLARRAPVVEQPRLVLLCDTSGSMDSHTRFLLTFMLSLKRVARRTEVFVFNTALTRVTPWISRGNVERIMEQLALEVPDWSGGTRIGESLSEFVSRYQNALVDSRTAVVILSDGLDRGDPRELVGAMRAIRARANTVIWLNPLLGDPRYRPLARGMEAALPFVDHFAPAHNLESLQRFLTLLAA
jgi:uncharacterized protein with von Willebrand factor type A (vWA) domain